MTRIHAVAVCLLIGSAIPCDAAAPGRLYCGVYGMYAALHAVGQEPNLEQMIDERYISSPFGSTLGDLQRIADDYHVPAVPIQGITIGMLRDAPGPVVLHVRRPRRGSPYQHWIVFLGVEDGMARVIDPPSGPEVVPFSEILAHWDGVGLMLSESPAPRWRLMRVGWLDQATHVTLAICVILAVAALVTRRRRYDDRRIVELGIVVGTSLVLAVAYHSVSAEGLIANPGAVASVVTRHHASNVPQLSLATFKARLKDNPVLIDVRLASAFEQGSIPGASSLPISSTTSERLRYWSAVPKDRQVILFCQSNQCGWSDELASEMVMRGYQNVSVYRGGYDEWQSMVANDD